MKLNLYFVLLVFCLSNSAWPAKTKLDKFEKVWGSGERFCSPKDLDKYLKRMVIATDLVTYMKMLSCRKQSVLIKAMDRFVKKIITGKMLERS